MNPVPFPLNRVLTFLSPIVAMVAGTAATWLFTHFPGLHIIVPTRDSAAKVIAEAIVFIVTTAGTFVIHHKWLDIFVKWHILPAAAPDPQAQAAAMKVHSERHGAKNDPAKSISATPVPQDQPAGGSVSSTAGDPPKAA